MIEGKIVLFICLFLIGMASMAKAEMRTQVKPYISVEGAYSDNLNSSRDKIDDFYTTISPGLAFSASSAPVEINFDGRLGFVFYNKYTSNNYTSADGTLNARYTPDPKLTFRVRDSVSRSDRTNEMVPFTTTGEYYLGARQVRSPYVRNVVEPSVDYLFSRQGSVGFTYRNNILRNSNDTLNEDNTEHFMGYRFSYQFDIRNSILLDYGWTKMTYQRSPDWTGHTIHGRYIYRMDPKMSMFVDYSFVKHQYDDFYFSGMDYDIHSPSAGVEYAINPTLSGLLQMGYYRKEPSAGEMKDGVSGNASLTQKTERTTYTLLIAGGYKEDFSSSNFLGFARYFRGVGIISHQLMPRFTLGLNASAERDEYDSGQTDWNYYTGANMSYQLLKWLSVNVGGGYNERSSSVDAQSYNEWRGNISLTATYL